MVLAVEGPAITVDYDLDPQAEFAAVYEAHYQTVYRAVRGVALDPALAEDITQDAFLKAYRARGRYRPRGRLEAWLCTIAVREALTRVRWLNVQRRLVELAGRQQRDAPPAALPDLVEEALSALSPRTRAAVVLHYHHGYRYREIARMLRVPEGTVASRLSAGLRRMRRHLEIDGRKLPAGSPSRQGWTRKR
jgi:RNA polymerase sigma-70 factor (ECF subfamily)